MVVMQSEQDWLTISPATRNLDWYVSQLTADRNAAPDHCTAAVVIALYRQPFANDPVACFRYYLPPFALCQKMVKLNGQQTPSQQQVYPLRPRSSAMLLKGVI